MCNVRGVAFKSLECVMSNVDAHGGKKKRKKEKEGKAATFCPSSSAGCNAPAKVQPWGKLIS